MLGISCFDVSLCDKYNNHKTSYLYSISHLIVL